MTIAAAREDILGCQFHRWIHLFLKETMKSKVFPLPENFVTYLLQDGVILPTIPGADPFGKDELSDDEDLFEPVEDNDVDTAPLGSVDDFHQLTTDITQAIDDLKGDVFIKLNWSAPTDASWLKGGSLKCSSATDVYLLLKSSDRIIYDIEHMFDQCPAVDVGDHSLATDSNDPTLSSHPSITFHLVLRKWANLNPAMEFRLFAGNKSILGICQRDCSTYYDFLINEMDDLEDLLVAFWTTKIRDTFVAVSKYSVDLYVDKKKRVWIVDFNPFGDPSSSLLFDWEELLTVAAAIASPVAIDGVTICTSSSSSSWWLETAAATIPTTSTETTVTDITAGVTTSSSTLGNVSLPLTSIPNTNPSPSSITNPSPSLGLPPDSSTSIPRRPLIPPSPGPCAYASPSPCAYEFRIIERNQDTLPPPAGASRGPIDVTLAPDFHKFMEICKQQRRDDEKEEND